jgi:hypothetical protein
MLHFSPSRRQLMRNSDRSHAWHFRFMPPRTGPVLAGVLALVLAMPVDAILLGDIVSVSAVGEPLRVDIRSPGASRQAAHECLRVVAPSAARADLIGLRNPGLAIVGAGTQARIRVTGNTPVFEPVVELALENRCDAQLRRDYTLLLSPPAAVVAAPLATPAAERDRRAAATGTPAATAALPAQRWVAAHGESIASIAAALYPDDANARRAFIGAVRDDNPQLFGSGFDSAAPLPAGTVFSVPSPARVVAAASRAPAAERPRVTAAAPSPARPPAAAAARSRAIEAPAARAADQLVLQTGEPRGAEPGAERGAERGAAGDTDAAMQAREERLVAAIDRSISLELELVERIRRLEEIRLALTAALEQSALAAAHAAAGPVALAVAHEAAAARARPDDAIPERPRAPQSSAPQQDWLMLAIVLAVLGTGAGALALRRRASPSRGRPAPKAPAEAVAATPVPAGARDDAAGDRRDPLPAPPSGATDAPPDGGGGAPPAAAAVGRGAVDMAALPSLTPLPLEGETVEEHDSAVELAEIMMSFGRVRGAAEMLAEFIESNPKQAITPWLKLMDVYRVGGMRAEFDALARELNRAFNVQAVTWDNFEQARNPDNNLERLPHIIDVLVRTWGTRDCQAYLEKILRDNRDGTRQGFVLGVIDDILMLAGVLELQIGRYQDKG